MIEIAIQISFWCAFVVALVFFVTIGVGVLVRLIVAMSHAHAIRELKHEVELDEARVSVWLLQKSLERRKDSKEL